MVAQAGRYLELGNVIPGESVNLALNQLVNTRMSIYTTVGYHPKTLAEVMDFMIRTKSRYPYDQVVSHKFPLERITQAFESADWHSGDAHGTPGRVLVTP